MLGAACGNEASLPTAFQHAASSAGAAALRWPVPVAADGGGPDLAAFEATGLAKYLGQSKPARIEPADAETHYYFDPADGRVCLRGGPFSMSTRDRGAEDLLIYLQGGGWCTTALCQATESASPEIPTTGLLDAADPDNPVAEWNVVYSPYCDGSLHFGDGDVPDQNRKHHGLLNVSAVLDVALAMFPRPRRVLLAGASAGGYGTIWITDLVRLAYPQAQLFVFNDAGIGLANPSQPDGFRSELQEWNARQWLPASCEACQTSPHLTGWMGWNLARDPGLTLALFSSYEDSVIADTYLMLDRSAFEAALLEETARVVATAPGRAKRFLIAGTQHTVGDLHETAVAQLSVGQWLDQMLRGDPAWDDVLQ
jgi:hypothetical protein